MTVKFICGAFGKRTALVSMRPSPSRGSEACSRVGRVNTVGARVPGESVAAAVSHREVTRALSRWEDGPMRLSGKSPSHTGTTGWEGRKAALQIGAVIAHSRLAMHMEVPVVPGERSIGGTGDAGARHQGSRRYLQHPGTSFRSEDDEPPILTYLLPIFGGGSRA